MLSARSATRARVARGVALLDRTGAELRVPVATILAAIASAQDRRRQKPLFGERPPSEMEMAYIVWRALGGEMCD